MTITSINRAEALRYMGQRSRASAPEGVDRLFDKCEKILLEALTPRFTYRVFDITHCDFGVMLSGTFLTLTGESIKKHLLRCSKAAVMCVTIGQGADDTIRKMSLSNIAEGFACDALASAAAEQACDKAELEIKLRFPGKFFTYRFSPGYGDLPIGLQKDFLAVTNAEKLIGVKLTGGMLVPTKSVTAVIGIADDDIKSKKKGCPECGMNDKCTFKKEGELCGPQKTSE